jgi:hypothetical protein
MTAVLSTARAADTVALACKGTVTIKAFGGRFTESDPDPISMGLVVNFANRTSGNWFDRPVTLPPGRARLATRPVLTGSP